MKGSVIHLADYNGSYPGNFIASLKSLEEDLPNIGVRQVFVFSESIRDRQWVPGFEQSGNKVYFLPPDKLIKQVKTILSIAERENGLLLHSHFNRFNISAWLAAQISRLSGRRMGVLWHFHNAFMAARSITRKIKDIILYRILARTVWCATVSADIRTGMIERGVFPERVFFVPNGVSIEHATSSDKTRAIIRDELGVPQNKKLLLAFGWDPITKGIDLVLEAVSALASQDETIALLLVGSTEMENYANDWAAGRRRDWLYLSRFRDKVAEYYTASDIFVSASRSEGFSYSVGEAMACGLPVISSDIPGLAWAKGAAGVAFFATGSVTSLLAAFKTVAAWSAQERQAKAEANRQYITSQYSLEIWSRNITDLYKKIIEQEHLFKTVV